MRIICGLCDKELSRTGEPHECKKFGDAFWGGFDKRSEYVDCVGCGRSFRLSSVEEMEEYDSHSCEDNED
jgi:hypothetical protein